MDIMDYHKMNWNKKVIKVKTTPALRDIVSYRIKISKNYLVPIFYVLKSVWVWRLYSSATIFVLVIYWKIYQVGPNVGNFNSCWFWTNIIGYENLLFCRGLVQKRIQWFWVIQWQFSYCDIHKLIIQDSQKPKFMLRKFLI